MRYLPRSEEFESVLVRLNRALAAEFGDDVPARRDLPTLQIVGLPRSGTTILHQLLAHTGAVGYPSNVMAMFWRTPAVGARLQRHLAGQRPTLSRTSLAGRTQEPLDPHEFGYFWRDLLGHDRNDLTPDRPPIDPVLAQHLLDSITSAFDQPVVHKNFLAPVHVDYLTRALERQLFVVVRRDAEEVVASLLRTRERLGVAPDAWFGPAPVDARAAYPSVGARVEHQVESLEATLQGCGLGAHPATVHVGHTELVRDPRGAIAVVLAHLDVDADEVDWDRVPASLDRMPPTRGSLRE